MSLNLNSCHLRRRKRSPVWEELQRFRMRLQTPVKLSLWRNRSSLSPSLSCYLFMLTSTELAQWGSLCAFLPFHRLHSPPGQLPFTNEGPADWMPFFFSPSLFLSFLFLFCFHFQFRPDSRHPLQSSHWQSACTHKGANGKVPWSRFPSHTRESPDLDQSNYKVLLFTSGPMNTQAGRVTHTHTCAHASTHARTHTHGGIIYCIRAYSYTNLPSFFQWIEKNSHIGVYTHTHLLPYTQKRDVNSLHSLNGTLFLMQCALLPWLTSLALHMFREEARQRP